MGYMCYMISASDFTDRTLEWSELLLGLWEQGFLVLGAVQAKQTTGSVPTNVLV